MTSSDNSPLPDDVETLKRFLLARDAELAALLPWNWKPAPKSLAA